MSVVNLESLLRPASVAVIGASEKPGSVGSTLTRNILDGGFAGTVWLVNPRRESVHGVQTFRDVASLPEAADLAIVMTPPHTVPAIVADLAARGTGAVVVISAGFGESREAAGAELQQAVLDAARPASLRVVGPNCLGVLVPGVGLNASFAHMRPLCGKTAFVAQSGAVVTSVLDWAGARNIGFSHLVSLGDMSDVDFADMLDYLADDPQVDSILLYIEAIKHARKFMSAARAAARTKPVIVVKGGRHAAGARAAASHTGALAGRDAVYDAAFRRAGMLRVVTLDDLFDAVSTLAAVGELRGDRLAILTNGGGIGVLATDSLIDHGGNLAELTPETIAALDEVLPPTWSGANPVDIIGDADGARYAAALRVLCRDPGADAVLVLNCPTAIASGREAAQAVIEVARERPEIPMLTSWIGAATALDARGELTRHGIATYDTPTQAVRAFTQLVGYRASQEALAQTPPSQPEVFHPDVDRARGLLLRALEEEREWLTEAEAKSVLAAYGIPVVRTFDARTPEEAAARAAELGSSVVLKIVSREITHKSDVGGVALDLEGPAATEAAARAMLERIAERVPDADLAGFSVQPMVRRPGAFELIVGAFEDRQFGPVVLFGQGGTAVELLKDRALGLPPLNLHLANEMMSRTRIDRLLAGYRDRRPADRDAIALTLVKVAQLVADLAEVAELDINPLLADAYGVVALDARIRVAPARGPAAERLAIRPYPKELEEDVPFEDERQLFLRPILPEDEPALQRGFARLTPEEIRMRFLVPLKTLSHVMAARFTQIDYNREMALVLTDRGVPGETEIYGVVRIVADPDNTNAEFAIIVRGDMSGRGLGAFLMRRIIEYCRARGVQEIYGDVLRENSRMLRLCRALGFSREPIRDDTALVRVSLNLSEAAPDAALPAPADG